MDTSTTRRMNTFFATLGALLAVTCAGAGTLPSASQATPTALVVAQDSACRNCGVVQSVVTVQRQGKARGIAGTVVTPGMAIGGVVGGLLGNQVGHGNGRAAATVVGAAGGAYAGNAIEKNRTRYTAYVLHVRMHDGSMRTVEQRTAIAKGARVVVEGNTARLARGQG
jgi:outer membrane lipoprotein SlyB